MTSTLLDVSKELNEAYEHDKQQIDRKNPNKGGMKYYVTNCKNLKGLKTKSNMKEVMYAIWDLLKLSLKTGSHSSLSRYLKQMRKAAISAGGMWECEFGMKECGNVKKYKDEMKKAGENFSRRLEQENKSISETIRSEKDGTSVGYSLVMNISVSKSEAEKNSNSSEYYDTYDVSLNWEKRAEKYK